MKKVVLDLSFFLLLGIAAGTQELAPGALSTGDLVKQTRAALQELTALEAQALADWEAFERNETDLRRAIVDIQKPLPQRPLPIDKVESTDPNYLNDQVQRVDAYRKAWEHTYHAVKEAAK